MNKKLMFLSLFGAIILHVFIFALGFEKNNVHALSNNSKKKINAHFVFLSLKKNKQEVRHAKKRIAKKTKTRNITKKVTKKIRRRKNSKSQEKSVQKSSLKKEQAKQKKELEEQGGNGAYNLKNLRNDYEKSLRKKIESNKIYPLLSRRMQEQGKVGLSFTILKSGVFEDIKITNSSGKIRLDKAGLQTILRTKKFKSFPKKLAKKIDFLHISIAINFYIKD